MTSNAQMQSQDTKNDKPEFENPRPVFGGSDKVRYHYNPSEAPSYDDEQETLVLSPSNSASPIKAKRSFWFRFAQTCGILGSVAWGMICVTYLLLQGGLATQTPYELGIFMAGMLAPVAFYWMLLSYLQRNNDVQYYAENLRAELHTLFFPSEEDSQRVNKDIERMTQQAAELASSSKAVLKSIQRTRHGLRQEIKEFANFASKAETHLLSLSDNLTTRTASVNDLVDQIEGRIHNIAEKSEASISAWDIAAAQMVERAGDIEGTMDAGAKRILAMANVAQEKSQSVSEMFDGTITSLGITVDAAIERLSGINNNFEAYTRTLSISVEDLAKETGRMSVMISDHVDQLQDAAGRSVESISQSLVSVSEQKDLLEETTNILSSKADIMAAAIVGSVTQLTNSADDIVGRAEATGEKLSEKTTMIAQSLDGLESQIERIDSVSELASHRLSEGIETAVSGSVQISDAIRRGVETLTRTSQDATQEATSLIEATIRHVEQLKDIGQGNMESVESMVRLLEQSRLEIEKASLSSQSHVETLTNAVENQSHKLETSAASLAEEVVNVTRALEEPLRLVNIAIADADGRHEQIEKTLYNRINDLKGASDKATESVETIRQSLREQTNDIASLSGRVVAQSKTLNEELTSNKSLLTDTIDGALNDMTRLMDGIAGQSLTISNASKATVSDIENVTQSLDTSMSRLEDSSKLSREYLSGTQTDLNNFVSEFENHIETAENVIKKANDNLISSSETLIPLYDKVDNGSHKALSQLRDITDNLENVTELSLSKLNITGTEFDKRLNQLEGGSKQASDILKTTSEDLRQKLDSIEFAATSANDKMHKLASAMDAQSSDMHIVTDQAVLKIENIQKLVNEQFRELAESVGQAVSQIEDAGLSFDKQSDKLSQQATDITTKLSNAGSDVEAKAYELKRVSQDISETAKDTVTDISSQMSILQNNSDESLSNLRKTSDTLSIKSREVDTMMQSALSQAKSYADDMKEQIRAVAAQSDQSANHISQSMTTLLGTMDNVNQKTKSVVSYISEANQSLYDQSGRFVTAVSKSAQAAEHATDMFATQANNLLKASHTALEKSDEIKKTELRVGRETFLSSARFVLESLHSLSIDFIRTLDGEVVDKDWKSYQKGDVALFSTKLAARLQDMPADKIRTKYAEDTEFRNYVQKFMRQFEDVLEQTDSVDRGAVLGTTFAASDVGKIYRFLVNVTGRAQNKAA